MPGRNLSSARTMDGVHDLLLKLGDLRKDEVAGTLCIA